MDQRSRTSDGDLKARDRWRGLVLSCALLATMTSCAHTDEKDHAAREAERRELDLLRERVGRLERQASDTHAKIDRVIAKLDEREASQGAPRHVPRDGGVDEKQDLDVVVANPPLTPSSSVDISRGDVDDDVASSSPEDMARESGATQANDDAPPIVIDAEALRRFDGGGKKSTRAARPRDEKSPTRIEGPAQRSSSGPRVGVAHRPDPQAPKKQSAPRAASETPEPMHANPKLVYKKAMQHLDDGRCDLAEQGFAAILTRSPDHELADNALYWTGVCRQRASRFEEARQLFADVPLRYPSSNKLADALFSLAEVHEAQGDLATARMYYTELVSRFPEAERARDAERALLRLGPK